MIQILDNIKYYSNIGLVEGIDLTKIKNSREFIVCHYWYFNHGFKLQKWVCNRFYDLLMISADTNDIAIIIIKGVDYCCNIYGVSKFDAIHLLENSMLSDRRFI